MKITLLIASILVALAIAGYARSRAHAFEPTEPGVACTSSEDIAGLQDGPHCFKIEAHASVAMSGS